jgi:hypothetical protein
MKVPEKTIQKNKLKPIIHQCQEKKETNHHNSDFKMKYPGREAYVFPEGTKHLSPCEDPFWRAQEIRQGNVREE